MLKTMLLASAMATAALIGTSATASAHSTGYWHSSHHVKPHFGASRYVVQTKLRRRGFYKIRIGSRAYRGYRVTACRSNRRFRMAVSQWGRIKWRAPAGYCGYRQDRRFRRDTGYRQHRRIRRHTQYADGVAELAVSQE